MKVRKMIIAVAVCAGAGAVWLAFGGRAVVALIAGFALHIGRVWPQLTWNLDLLVPFAAAYGLAIAIGHGMLRGPMRRRDVRWRIDHTLCVAALFPLWLATAFLVPGVLLQLRLFLEAIE